MLLCPNCKKDDAGPTNLIEIFTSWFMHHVMPKTLNAERTEARMEGFSEGYRLSGKVGQEIKQMQYQMDRLEDQLKLLILQTIKDKFPNV